MSKKLKIILILIITAVFFLLIKEVVSFQMAVLYPKTLHSPQLEMKNEEVTFGNNNFTMAIPEGWISDEGRAWNPNNPVWSISGGKIEVADNNTRAKSLISEGKVREFEIDLMVKMCQETDACGKISDFKTVKAPEGVQSFEFFVTYSGTGKETPQGFTTEAHRTNLVDGKLYRFWTSTDSSAGKDSSEIKNFKSIVDTFEVKKSQ